MRVKLIPGLMSLILGLAIVGCAFTNEPDPGFAGMSQTPPDELGGASEDAPGSRDMPALDLGVSIDADDVSPTTEPSADAGQMEDGGEIGRGLDDACGPLGICAPNGGWCEPAGRSGCQANPGNPVCYEPDSPLSIRFCGDQVDCVSLGECVEGGYCEPDEPESCHGTPGDPVCYPAEHPISVRYCAGEVDCSMLGVCAPNGGWCEPATPNSCHENPGFPVCHTPDSPVSQRYCGEVEAPNCDELGRCGPTGGWCEPEDEPRCQMDPGGPVCFEPDHPLSQQNCPAPNCQELGRCGPTGGWCEPEDEPRCQMDPGGPVCFEPDHPLSIENCPAPDCESLGRCGPNGGWCEPEDEPRCQMNPGSPVCLTPDHPTSQMYCAMADPGEGALCRVDRQCPNGWCRATANGPRRCAPWQASGGRCGGRVEAHMVERCAPDHVCTDYPIPGGDIPGYCRPGCADERCPEGLECSEAVCRSPADCQALGSCGPAGEYCEPPDEPRCQEEPGRPRCLSADHPRSQMYCQ